MMPNPEQTPNRTQADTVYDKGCDAERKQEKSQALSHFEQAYSLYRMLGTQERGIGTRMKLIEKKISMLQKVVPQPAVNASSPTATSVVYEKSLVQSTSSTRQQVQYENLNEQQGGSQPSDTLYDEANVSSRNITEAASAVSSTASVRDLNNLMRRDNHSSSYSLSEAVSQLLDKTKIKESDVVVGEKLGNGAFGTVYKAIWRNQFAVVIKRLSATQLTCEQTKEFVDEAKMMYVLRHPNIVDFYGLTDGATPGLVIEFAKGGTLRDFYIKKHRANVSWQVRINMARDIAAGLDYLHSQRQPVIHGDIKSDNILLFENNVAKLSDFGLSVIKKVNGTDSTALLSKKEKMMGVLTTSPPEIFQGTEHSPKTDMYSYGVILWEMATHQLPFTGLTRLQIIERIKAGQRECFPDNTPTHYQQLAEASYGLDASKRPTAAMTLEQLNQALHGANATQGPPAASLEDISVPMTQYTTYQEAARAQQTVEGSSHLISQDASLTRSPTVQYEGHVEHVQYQGRQNSLQ